MSVETSETEYGTDPFGTLIDQVVLGYFFLTDGQGKISRWDRTAERLFGGNPAEILGKPLFGTIIDSPYSDEAEAWLEFLEGGKAPATQGLVSALARQLQSGNRFGVELAFVPVKLTEGFDFSRFLEDLTLGFSASEIQERVWQHHPVVGRALRAALESGPEAWNGERAAGTLVIVRPTEPTPWADAPIPSSVRGDDGELESDKVLRDLAAEGEVTQSDAEQAASFMEHILDGLDRISALEDSIKELSRKMGEGFAGLDTQLVAQVDDLRVPLLETHGLADAARREAEQARIAAQSDHGGGQSLSIALRELMTRHGVGSDETAPPPVFGHPSLPEPDSAVEEAKPKRPVLPGFDDDPTPLARLSLDGRFTQINPAFERVVGYDEHEFADVTWPSGLDKQAFSTQEEQLTLLGKGELDTVDVQSSYMHGQGLLVPIVGELSLVRDDDREPSYLLLRTNEPSST